MNFSSVSDSDFLETGVHGLSLLLLLLLFEFLLVTDVSCLITNTSTEQEKLQSGVEHLVP